MPFRWLITGVVSPHGIGAMMYADDSQLYIVIKRSNRHVALDQLEVCIDDLCWNTQNGLNQLRLKSSLLLSP